MARSLRIEYPGAFYHVMARGNRREKIFRDDTDRRFFLQTLADACQRTGWRVHAWVLLDNHYHLLIETPQPNLVVGMGWLQNTYTRRFNTRHRLWGRLFGDRYKAVPVEGAGYYYQTLLDYIHLNPVRARLLDAARGQSVRDYAWSSVASGYALPPRRRAPWLACAEALAACGFEDDSSGRRRFVDELDRRAVEEGRTSCGVAASQSADGRRSHLRHGWFWGSQAFAERLLKVVATGAPERSRSTHYRNTPEQQAHDEKTAEEIVRNEMQAENLEEAELQRLPGSEPRKVRIARAVRQQTTVSLAWIAARLRMRSAGNVCQCLRRETLSPSKGIA